MFRSLISGRPVCSAGIPLPPAEKTACITGHRENGIVPYGNNEKYRRLTTLTVKYMLFHKIDEAIENGYNVFIDGLAVGTDLWSAEYIAEKKKNGSNIMLIGVMPFLRHADYFPKNYREMLKRIENSADYLITTCPDSEMVYKAGAGESSASLYRERNYFMVDNSSAVISFFNKERVRSGTAQTLNYARKKDRLILNFGLEEVYSTIRKSKGDISRIKQEIALMDIQTAEDE